METIDKLSHVLALVFVCIIPIGCDTEFDLETDGEGFDERAGFQGNIEELPTSYTVPAVAAAEVFGLEKDANARADETEVEDGRTLLARLPDHCYDSADCSQPGFFCSKGFNDCGSEGICIPAPTSCSGNYSFTCGCNGQGYYNSCYANKDGKVSVQADSACGMSGWMDRDDPDGSGDWEHLSAFAARSDGCSDPVLVECRTTGGLTGVQTGEVLRCGPDVGLICLNSDQPDGTCDYDYKMRGWCP